MNKIFVDSNFFIALYNHNDSLHQKAHDLSKNLLEIGYDLYISNYIFSEIATVLSQRTTRKESIVVGNFLLENGDLTIKFVDHNLQELSWNIFCETPKKNTSFVDCSTIAVMQAEGVDKLLTFDQEDFKPLLKKHHLSLF